MHCAKDLVVPILTSQTDRFRPRATTQQFQGKNSSRTGTCPCTNHLALFEPRNSSRRSLFSAGETLTSLRPNLCVSQAAYLALHSLSLHRKGNETPEPISEITSGDEFAQQHYGSHPLTFPIIGSHPIRHAWCFGGF